jgi:archaellum component FlaC
MSLTLDSLHDQMKHSFGEVHQRIDVILLRLEQHIRNTDMRFDEVDEHFQRIEHRFDTQEHRFEEMTKDVVGALSVYSKNIESILDNHEKRISVLEESS